MQAERIRPSLIHSYMRERETPLAATAVVTLIQVGRVSAPLDATLDALTFVIVHELCMDVQTGMHSHLKKLKVSFLVVS